MADNVWFATAQKTSGSQYENLRQSAGFSGFHWRPVTGESVGPSTPFPVICTPQQITDLLWRVRTLEVQITVDYDSTDINEYEVNGTYFYDEFIWKFSFETPLLTFYRIPNVSLIDGFPVASAELNGQSERHLCPLPFWDTQATLAPPPRAIYAPVLDLGTAHREWWYAESDIAPPGRPEAPEFDEDYDLEGRVGLTIGTPALDGGNYYPRFFLGIPGITSTHRGNASDNTHSGDLTLNVLDWTKTIPLYTNSKGDKTTVSATATAKTFWPYANSGGLPIYNTTTGAQLRDPVS